MDLPLVVGLLKSIFTGSGRKSFTLEELARVFAATEETEVPYAQFGYPTLAAFLEGAAEMRVQAGVVYFESKKAQHLSRLIEGQKIKPKLAPSTAHQGPKPVFTAKSNTPKPVVTAKSNTPKPVFTAKSNTPKPVVTAKSNTPKSLETLPGPTSYGLPIPSCPVQFNSEKQLIAYCNRLYAKSFQYELHRKLQSCPPGVSPAAFVEHFNRTSKANGSDFEDLDFRNLMPLDFFRGLPEVFLVKFENDSVKIYPAPESSFRSSTPSVANDSCPSLPRSPPTVRSRLPTVNEMVGLFKRVNHLYAGQEVGIQAYEAKVTEIGGEDAARWLKIRNFTTETLLAFLRKNSLGYTFQLGRRGDVIRISMDASWHESAAAAATPEEITSSNNEGLSASPEFTAPFTVKRLPCDNKSIDIYINEFGSPGLRFHFSLSADLEARKNLMGRLRDRYRNGSATDQLSPENVSRGLRCVAPSEEGDFYRVLVLQVEGGRARVFCADFGMQFHAPVGSLRRIAAEFCQDSVYAYQAVLANVHSEDGSRIVAPKDEKLVENELWNQVLKARILKYCEREREYHVDLSCALRSLEESGLFTLGKLGSPHHSNATTPSSESTAAPSQSKVFVEKRILPNCENVGILHLDGSRYVSASNVSRIVGLDQNTVLSDLRDCHIAVTDCRWPTPSVLKLLEKNDICLLPGESELLVPLKAVGPLFWAYRSLCSEATAGEKTVARTLVKWANSS